MRVAVAGATGLVGCHTVSALRRSGHEPVAIARSDGVDLITGDGLDDALVAVDAVIDVTNTAATNRSAAGSSSGPQVRTCWPPNNGRALATTWCCRSSASTVSRAMPTTPASAARRRSCRSGSVPFTIVRATQFHEFAGMVVGWTRRDGTAVVPPLLVQPVAAADVGQVLAEIATASPSGIVEVAGPEPQDLVDMARRTLHARGERLTLIPTWRVGPFTAEMAGEVLLPGAAARIAATTFDDWLTTQTPTP